MTETSPVNILLVDDQPQNLLALEVVLAPLGETLVRATSGHEALHRVLATDFAAILLDVRMPGMSGFEAAKLIRSRKRSRTTPIIFVTASEGTDFSEEDGYALGAVDFLTKPVSPAALRSKVAVFAELHRGRERLRAVERQRAAAALREKDERLNLLLDNIRDYAVIITDPHGTVVEWLGGAERITGYAPAEATGQQVHLLFTPEDRAAGRPEHEMRAAAETGRAENTRWHQRKDGSRFFADGVTTPLRHSTGTLHGFGMVFRDATRQRHAEDALRQLAADLSDADRRKDEFLATLAHELRNPLAPIRNGLTILAREHPGGDRGRLVGMMDRQLVHLVRLVDDLLDVSRVTTGKVTLRRERVAVQAVLATAVETSRPLVEQAGHDLRVAAPDGPLVVDGDPTRLAQVVTNLLNNAAKYTPPGGRIEVSAAAGGGEAVVRVSDNGLGIPADMLPKVFDLFTQVGRSIDRSQGGLGIGLSLVRKLVEMHGGSVTVESAGPGQGSTFTVRLPLAGGATAEPAPPAGPGGTRPATGARRILIVDDNVDAADSLALLLGIGGHTVTTAYNGPDAVAAAARTRPDVVFLDIGLPGMNGYEVAERLRGDPAVPRPVLVALTGWGSPDDRARAVAAGFDHHLTKPADGAQVTDLLARLGADDRNKP